MKATILIICILLYANLNAQYEYLNNDTIRIKRHATVNDGLIEAYNPITNKYGFIDTIGNVRIAFNYRHIFNFNNQAAIVQAEDGFTYIDTTGVRITQKTFPDAYPFQNNLAIVSEDGRSYGIINKEGEYIISPSYDFIYSSRNKYFVVVLDGARGVVDKYNGIIYPIEYDNIENFKGKLFFMQSSVLCFINIEVILIS